MSTTKERIEEIRSNGYQLDFGTVFEHAFENYRKIALYAGSMLLVFSVLIGIVVIGIAFSVATAIFNVDVDSITKMLQPENLQPENFSVNFLLIYFTIIVLITCLISPFQAGFLKMADCGEKGEEFHVATIFEYYKAPYFKEIIVSTFLITLMSAGLSMAIEFSGIKIIGTIISMTISFLTFLTIPLIVFGKLDATEAIKSSVVIIAKQPFLLLALLIVAGIASIVGFIGCCIGVFFTIPFVYSMYYVIYSEIIGVDSESEMEEIIES
ncbi:hypothetical protein [uncultured Flavobacterium sp.]|uniref:hypothetical protein n=1 Tax=uncultured Flavobacterium sp. TaxID=165435 RepID=UPI0030CA4767